MLLVGAMGPRGDGYVAGDVPDPDEAADYHSVQIRSFAAAGADLVSAVTITSPQEAMGVVAAARAAGIPVAVGFTVETDGRLPDGTPLGTAIEAVDAAGGPDWFVVNCAHPTHIAPAFDGGDWQSRIAGVRPNSSTMTHEELDAMEELDEGDMAFLVSSLDALRPNCRPWRSSAAAAAPTPATSPRSGAWTDGARRGASATQRRSSLSRPHPAADHKSNAGRAVETLPVRRRGRRPAGW